MKLGVNVSPQDPSRSARLAERLGFDVAFVAEGYRSDAVSVLGHLAGTTDRIALASGVLQIPGRSPVMTTMTAATLDTLSGGRFRLGLGVSNLQITSGWHGLAWDRPLGRTREYVHIVREALAGRLVQHAGEHYRIPLSPEAADGFQLPGGPRPMPIYLAAVGPRSLELAGEIADGWFGVFCSTERVVHSRALLDRGRARAALTGDYEVMVSAPILVDDDLERGALPVQRYVSRFVSLGHRDHNVYYRLLAQMGYRSQADRIQDLMATGDHDAAARAVPLEFVERTALVGDPQRIARRLVEYRDAGVTTLALSPLAADAMDRDRALTVAAAAFEHL